MNKKWWMLTGDCWLTTKALWDVAESSFAGRQDVWLPARHVIWPPMIGNKMYIYRRLFLIPTGTCSMLDRRWSYLVMLPVCARPNAIMEEILPLEPQGAKDDVALPMISLGQTKEILNARNKCQQRCWRQAHSFFLVILIFSYGTNEGSARSVLFFKNGVTSKK